MSEITMAIPSILANKMKQRYRSDTCTFHGPQETLPNGVLWIRKGIKYFLKGDNTDIDKLIRQEPNVIQAITNTINHAEEDTTC